MKMSKRQIWVTGENRWFGQCILDWTNQCKNYLPLVAKSAFLQAATAAHIAGPICKTFFCSGSLKPGRFGYLGQTALALTGPIYDTLVESTIFNGIINSKFSRFFVNGKLNHYSAYQIESFSSKWKLPFLLSASLITRRRMEARKAALIFRKNSHFDRTPQY